MDFLGDDFLKMFLFSVLGSTADTHSCVSFLREGGLGSEIISCPLVSDSHLSCVWESPDECRLWIPWEMTSGYVSLFRVYLGRQWIHVHASVPVACGQISEIFHVKVDFGS